MMGHAADPLSLLEIRRRVHEMVAEDPRVVGVYFFGSRQRGDGEPSSDLDLGILFREDRVEGSKDPENALPGARLRALVDLQIRLEEVFEMPVDLVDAGRANAYLALDIVRGERIFCRDVDRCDLFDLYVLRRAADLEPFERERRRMLLIPRRERLARRETDSPRS